MDWAGHVSAGKAGSTSRQRVLDCFELMYSWRKGVCSGLIKFLLNPTTSSTTVFWGPLLSPILAELCTGSRRTALHNERKASPPPQRKGGNY